MANCAYQSLRSVINHLPVFASVRQIYDAHTLDGNVRTVWIKYEYLNRPYIPDVLCFLPEARPRNLNIRQHAKNTNNAVTPRLVAQAAGGDTTRVSQVRSALLCLIG